ncbi:MAG: CpaF family protein [Acidimicrobiales bacterium]
MGRAVTGGQRGRAGWLDPSQTTGRPVPGKLASGNGLYGRLQEGMTKSAPRATAIEAVREQVHRRVIAELGPAFYDGMIEHEELRARVQRIILAALSAEKTPLSSSEAAELERAVTDDVLGYGPIQRLLADPTVSEIMVNGPGQVYIERDGKILPTKISFLDEGHLCQVVGRIVAEVGRHIDESSPMVDARLPDGSRVNAVYPPLAVGGPFLTVRKFATGPLAFDDLVRAGTFSWQVGELLRACVVGRANILVSGGASTGKTTLLNVLSSFIPADERIITLEDAKELQLRQRHVLSLESRPPNTEGKGEVTIRELLRNALRMRPDRIIIGECRAGEALDMLQAMNTGHDGSLTTVHANSPRDALSRVETMTLMAGFDIPARAVREQMSSALDLIVHVARLRDGTRKVVKVSEVGNMEGDVVLLQDIFVFDHRAGANASPQSLGQLRATGLRPHLMGHLADRGVSVDPVIFEPSVDVRGHVGIGHHSPQVARTNGWAR